MHAVVPEQSRKQLLSVPVPCLRHLPTTDASAAAAVTADAAVAAAYSLRTSHALRLQL